MSAIPNLSQLTLIKTEPTGVVDPKRANMVLGDENPLTNLPDDLGLLILEILMMSFDGPKKVCKGLSDLMSNPGLRSKTAIGQLLPELATDPVVQEQVWRMAFLKYFGLERTPSDSPIKDSDLIGEESQLIGKPAFSWAELFHRMCHELRSFGQAGSWESNIVLDWKNNANWTAYEMDEMLVWLISWGPRKDLFGQMVLEHLLGENDYNRFYSYTMQSVLRLRYADPAQRKKRIRNNKRFYELLVSDVGYPQALEILNEDPMKTDIDLSPPVRTGVKELGPQPYHRVIATLTVEMMNNGILSKEQIETSHYKHVMEKLIQKAGASPNVSSLQNWVPLCEAINHGDHVAVIDMLMNLGASTDNEVKYYPEVRYRPTPLMSACNDGERLLSVQALLRWGAKVNASRGDGWTPLTIACAHCKSVELVRILLLAGADPVPHTRSPNASTPRHREYREDPSVVVRRVPSQKSKENMDQIAALLQQPRWFSNGQ